MCDALTALPRMRIVSTVPVKTVIKGHLEVCVQLFVHITESLFSCLQATSLQLTATGRQNLQHSHNRYKMYSLSSFASW